MAILPHYETTFPLKMGVVVKIEGVEYSEATGGVPESIATLFIAKNILRYELFEEIENLNQYVQNVKQTKDFEPIDIDDSNDTDIFIYGKYSKLPIKVALAILEHFLNISIGRPYSKAIIQQAIRMLANNKYEQFVQYSEEWLSTGTADGYEIKKDGTISSNPILRTESTGKTVSQ